MKRVVFTLIIGLFLISIVTAGASFEDQPNEVYNIGDKIKITMIIETDIEIEAMTVLNLNCKKESTEIYREFIIIDEDLKKNVIIPLVPKMIGDSIGFCTLELVIDKEESTERVNSDEFKISDQIKIKLELNGMQFTPGEIAKITGTATKENGDEVEGFLEGRIEGNLIEEKIENGKFEFNLKFKDNIAAGEHIIDLKAFELDKSGTITNIGETPAVIEIKQIPKNIEILLEKRTITPNQKIEGQIILYDQTGEKIKADAYVAIKNESNEIVKKIQTKTETKFSYSFNTTQEPGTWIIAASSGDLINRVEITIDRYELIESEFINDTLILKNKGNVPYNHSFTVQIGNESIKIPLLLEVNEEETYFLTAPEGKYEIIAGGKKQMMFLTGSIFGVEKTTNNTGNINIYIWIIIIIIFVIIAYFLFRKIYKKASFASYVQSMPIKNKEEPQQMKKQEFSNATKKLELSLSITGTKQNATVGCIALKNFEEIKNGEGNVKETLAKITRIIEESKGLIYKNNQHIFYIFAPSVTKTFENQITGANIVKQIQEILVDHNKKFKQKISYGLSLNYGAIILRNDPESIKFMSLGSLMTITKKIANFSIGDIFLTNTFKDKIGDKIKTTPQDIGTLKAFKLEDIKTKENHSTFISGFLARQKKAKESN